MFIIFTAILLAYLILGKTNAQAQFMDANSCLNNQNYRFCLQLNDVTTGQCCDLTVPARS